MFENDNTLSGKAHGYIRRVSYVGGALDGVTIDLSSGLNALIGIRGSGKSAVLETIRYALGINKEGDEEDERTYRRQLVTYVLNGGGKVVLDIVSRFGQAYRVERINGEAEPSVYLDGVLQPGITIGETVITHPLYFGQKDLANQSSGFGQELLKKLTGERFAVNQQRIESCANAVREAVAHLKTSEDEAAQLEECRARRDDIKRQLDVFAKTHLEERLEGQMRFEEELAAVGDHLRAVRTLHSQLSSAFEDAGTAMDGASCGFDGMPEEAAAYAQLRDKIKRHVGDARQALDGLSADMAEMEQFRQKLLEVRSRRAEEFASVMRDVVREIGDTFAGTQIKPEEFVALRRRLAQVNQAIELLERHSRQEESRRNELMSAIKNLQDAWLDDFQARKGFYDQSAFGGVSVKVDYQGGREAFSQKIREVVHGLRFRDTTFQEVVGKYQNFSDMYSDWANARACFGTKAEAVEQAIKGRLGELLVYRVPDKVTITYCGQSLQELSIGQRASVLMMYILAQTDRDLIIIDQPEDDLDNQTIYSDVIKTLQTRKLDTQFIFATHNPNIPVLGDAEQVIVCSMAKNGKKRPAGGLDSALIRSHIIGIMEGGKEAFAKRKEIYGQWT